MNRNLQALKLIVENLDEHSQQIEAVEKKLEETVKISLHQSKEIESLRTRVRDLEIREKSRRGVKKKIIANEYSLSAGRISQITLLKKESLWEH